LEVEAMPAIASLVCGFIFGWGLFISGMIRPSKVLGFLDVLEISNGNWDPSLAFVMAAALIVTGIGYRLLQPRTPLFDARSRWPTATKIDAPLIGGAVLFGIGWGLAGLCPGPAIENLATLSPGVIVFVIAMAVGMIGQNLWQSRRRVSTEPSLAHAKIADG
jgi:uncharacterized protein